jgi:hypothetical protein
MHNGQLVDENLLLMIEQLAGNDMNEMQKGLEAVETCSGIRMSKTYCKTTSIPQLNMNRWNG